MPRVVPDGHELRKERLDLRLPAAAKQQIEKAAELQGRNVSDFVLAAALSQASEVIEQQMVHSVRFHPTAKNTQNTLQTTEHNRERT